MGRRLGGAPHGRCPSDAAPGAGLRAVLAVPTVLAVGGHLKSSLALSRGERVLLSPHLGDLDDEGAFDAFLACFETLTELYAHEPEVVAVDMHQGYRTDEWGRRLAAERGLSLVEVQHHHAHVAACLAESGWRPERDDDVALGIALDGLGMGRDGQLWGGEVLLARYDAFRRFGTLKPVAMLGGDEASREPWRNLYARLMAEMGWAELKTNFAGLPLVEDLMARPHELLDSMSASGTQCPPASSCGRSFDAVAAALDLHRDVISFEGQAAMALEAMVTSEALEEAEHGDHYPVAIPNLGGDGLPYVEPLGIWRAILEGLHAGVDRPLIAVRFHVALADGVTLFAQRTQRQTEGLRVAALSGGCFQNAVLLSLVMKKLASLGLEVLTHARVPPNDGCIALGQAAVAAAAKA